MKRRVVGIALICLVLLAAIFAGYWDMLNTETVRVAGDKAAVASNEVAALAKPPAGQAEATTAPVPETPAAAKEPVLPSFDILRVEPDGSTVMAGKAAAGATVRLTDGTTVLGEETAGPAGDFAVVFDKPLPVGEHQIRIEATAPDGQAATSRETAIVSVPERGRENELLAMVETPDQPSRLISVPKAEPASTAAADARQAATPAAPAATGDASPASPAANPSGEPASVAAVTGAASIGAGADRGVDPTGAPNLVAEGALAVEAVEIEDDMIYVAGRAPVGPTVRVYVDNVFLAEDARRTGDRFLVSTRSPVSPGDHMVRADQVAPDGSVLARVEVPFVKPEGRSMSAVAGSGAAASAGAGPSEPGSTGDGGGAAGANAPSAGTASGAPQPSGGTPDAAGATQGAPSVASGRPVLAGEPLGTQPPAGSDPSASRQAPLQAAGARVIIRRGDTLWRISREAYGQGARYTTIYLANGDQIRNPNRIYPGQVFRMPDGAAE